MKCGAVVSYPALGISKYMMKCYSKLTYVMGAMADDLDFGFRIAGLAQEYGVDGYTAPQVMAFAVELYEDGILTDQDLPGFPSGNEERFFWLLEKIVRREGIGDILANGTYWAARQIGKGAEAYDRNTIKKHEQIPIKLGMLNPIYFLMYSTGEKINITQIEGQLPQVPFATREEREAFVKDWIQAPDDRFKEFFLNWELRGENAFPYYPTPEATCDIVEWQETMHYIDDTLGICAGLSSFPIKPPYHIHNFPRFISAATGMDLDKDGLWNTIRRVRTLVRAVNVRRGLRRTDEKPPEDHWKKRFPELEQKLLDTYYQFKGWNSEGVPTKEMLERVDLSDVAEDFLQRGILKEGEKPPLKETPEEAEQN
jgi:benzoyl-CoA reductase subunit BamB